MQAQVACKLQMQLLSAEQVSLQTCDGPPACVSQVRKLDFSPQELLQLCVKFLELRVSHKYRNQHPLASALVPYTRAPAVCQAMLTSSCAAASRREASRAPETRPLTSEGHPMRD